jgi:protein arginine kinase
VSFYDQLGADGEIVVTSRVRLARNFAEFPFPGHMTEAEEQKVLDFARNALDQYDYLPVNTMPPMKASALVERHLISRELLSATGPRGVLLSKNESISIMVGEEDHIRIQALCAGFAPGSALKRAVEADRILEQAAPYAFDRKLGYLTKCPTNLGTGLRAGVMMHLPLLTEQGAIRDLMASLNKLGFIIRGLYGEGTAAQGDLYQVSNQVTLGIAEEEIVSRLEQVVGSILNKEEELRRQYQKMYPTRLLDRCQRAAGLLATARILTQPEAMKLCSHVRLGLSCGCLKGISMAEMNRLLFEMQPGCLVSQGGENRTYLNLDQMRADMARQIAQKAVLPLIESQ